MRVADIANAGLRCISTILPKINCFTLAAITIENGLIFKQNLINAYYYALIVMRSGIIGA